MTSGIELELIWRAGGRCFTLPVVVLVVGANLWQCQLLIILPGRRANLRLETRVTSDGFKLLIDEAGVGVKVRLCHILASSKQLHGEGKQRGSCCYRCLQPTEKCDNQKEKCFLPAHPYLHFRFKLLNSALFLANPPENTKTKSHPKEMPD